MQEINASFARIEQILPLFHITMVIFLIGSQVAITSISLFFLKVKKTKTALKILLKYLNIFQFAFVIFTVAITVSGYFLSLRDELKFSDPMIEGIVATEFVLILFLFINFFYISYRIFLLKKSILKNQNDEIEDHIIIISHYFVPLNIVVCLIAVYLGVVIKEF